ncbi:MAG: hypothetical protein GXO62_06840 [Epsilonproteobacteria bacterium]|nr:hypothetical protein [Campylobacterota bacterium]
MTPPIKDIKPNIQLVDYDFFIFLGFLSAAAVLIIYTAYIFYKKKIKPKKERIQRLKSISLNDPKFLAYNFRHLSYEFVNEKNKDLFEEITNELEKYKYIPSPPPLNDKLKNNIKKFIKGL